MSFTKYPKNWHANGYGWHNNAALSYPKPPSPTKPSGYSPGASSIYPSAYGMPVPGRPAGTSPYPTMPMPGAPGMPPLPGSNYYNSGNAQLSYGFAPNILPTQIPNVHRNDSIESPGLGWNIGGGGGGRSIDSFDSGVLDPAKAQKEIPCQAIHVPEDEMPIYSFFGLDSVSIFSFSFNMISLQFIGILLCLLITHHDFSKI